MKEYKSKKTKKKSSSARKKGSQPFTQESLLAFFESVPYPLGIDAILRFSHRPRGDKDLIRELIYKLVDAGHLARTKSKKKGRKFTWAPTARFAKLQGHVDIQRSGAAFVILKQEGEKKRKDIYIPAKALNNAWHKDLVEILIIKKEQRNPHNKKQYHDEGTITNILERKTKSLMVQQSRETSPFGRLFVPTDYRYPHRLLVNTSALESEIEAQDIVLVEDIKLFDKAPSLWTGKAIEILGKNHSVWAQEQLAKYHHNIPTAFPDVVLAEAESIAQNADIEGLLSEPHCVDLRDKAFVTIDGEDAKDFDDAIFVQEHEGGFDLWVAIADVSRYVRTNSLLDKEAQQRGNSAYFPLSVEPMLPEALSNNLCSLIPHKARAVMVAHMRMNHEAICEKADFMSAVICSHARLTYNLVQSVLENKDTANIQTKLNPEQFALIGDHIPMLLSAAKLAKGLLAKRKKEGSLDLDIPEAKVIFENDSPSNKPSKQGQKSQRKDLRIVDIVRRKDLEANRLIEACMLAANEAVARFLTEKGLPFPYRVHPKPDKDSIKRLREQLKHSQFADIVPSSFSALSLPALLNDIDTSSDAEAKRLAHRMVLRAMMQAQYDQVLEGHFGLASKCYCHFTSPIRRYPDLLVHRALRQALGCAFDPIAREKTLARLCDTCNKRERSAIDAERESLRRLSCLFLLGREGEFFEGIISAVMSFGFFVEFDAMPVEGIVPMESLTDGYYAHDADRQSLVSRRGRTFTVGDKVRTRLVEINLNSTRIVLEVEKELGLGS